MTVDDSPAVKERQRWLKILASADAQQLQQLWQNFTGQYPLPEFSFIRPPETGLTMLQGRIGGTGQPFNVGELTITRCALRLSSGTMGVGYITGRNRQHCETVALTDALMRESEFHPILSQQLIEPLALTQQAEKQQSAAEVQSTKVDFFTLVRGED